MDEADYLREPDPITAEIDPHLATEFSENGEVAHEAQAGIDLQGANPEDVQRLQGKRQTNHV